MSSDLTLSISSAGQHRDGFTGSGQILDEFPGVLSLRRHGASHVSAGSLSEAAQGEITSDVTSEDGSGDCRYLGWAGDGGSEVELQWLPPSTGTYTPPEQRSSLW